MSKRTREQKLMNQAARLLDRATDLADLSERMVAKAEELLEASGYRVLDDGVKEEAETRRSVDEKYEGAIESTLVSVSLANVESDVKRWIAEGGLALPDTVSPDAWAEEFVASLERYRGPMDAVLRIEVRVAVASMFELYGAQTTRTMRKATSDAIASIGVFAAGSLLETAASVRDQIAQAVREGRV